MLNIYIRNINKYMRCETYIKIIYLQAGRLFKRATKITSRTKYNFLVRQQGIEKLISQKF